MRKEPTKSNIFCLLRGLMHDFLDLCQLCVGGMRYFVILLQYIKEQNTRKKRAELSGESAPNMMR